MTTPRNASLAAIAATALALGACGGGEPSTADKFADQAEEQAAKAPDVAAEKPVTAITLEPTSGEADLESKPEIPKSGGPAPTELKVEDLIVGDGAAAKAGDQISVQYVGVLYKNGEEFDASWKGSKPGDPFPFALGGGAVIAGWDQGLVGMKVGGRRKLTIPAALAYGEQGSPPKIGPNEALIFEVDLKKIG